MKKIIFYFKSFLRKLLGIDSLVLDNSISLAIARGQVNAQNRIFNIENPNSWEFLGFSQNGEDGIIDFLSRMMISHNNYFIEIGAGDGMENNTTWLAFTRKWSGLMIDGSEKNSILSKRLVSRCPRVKCLDYFVSLDNVNEIQDLFANQEPDVFSLDIDGNDFHIMKQLLIKGFRPGIIIVEYNSALGPGESWVLKYDKNFTYSIPLNFGTSISAWRGLFDSFKYRFISVDSNGINAFFVEPVLFESLFLERIKGSAFQENIYMRNLYKAGWEEQIKLIDWDLFYKID